MFLFIIIFENQFIETKLSNISWFVLKTMFRSISLMSRNGWADSRVGRVSIRLFHSIIAFYFICISIEMKWFYDFLGRNQTH